MDCHDDCCHIYTNNTLKTRHHRKIIQCHKLGLLPHSKQLYVTQYNMYSLLKQFKLIFIPSGFPSCVTTRGLVKVFLLCIMAKIISTLREVQASSGGMHWEWGKKKSL